jgi:superfamily II DNA or RNA helicase
MDYLYTLTSSIYEANEYKIGSSNNPKNRRISLNTGLKQVLKPVLIFGFPKGYARVVEEYFRQSTSEYIYRIPPEKYNNLIGGTEHYRVEKIEYISEFVKQICEELNISYQKVNWEDLPESDEPHKESTIPLLIKPLQFKPKFELRYYQKDAVKIFINKLKDGYFNGIYLMATGTGKTAVIMNCCLEHLKMYPDDKILWLTFRNDIVNSQMDSQVFKNNLDKIVFLNEGQFDINKLNQKGKIFISLRQSLLGKGIPLDTFQGLFYDECQDSSKDFSEGRTYEFMSNLRGLRYRVGFSATPFTDSSEQHQGLTKLYGKDYLYKYDMFMGIKDGFLLPPEITFINQRTPEYLSLLLNQGIYGKSVVWCNSVEETKELAGKIKIKGMKVSYSTGEYNKDDTMFKDALGKHTMIACKKFTTGYDAKNMEFGVNLCPNEAGYLIIQKLGRFTRNNKADVSVAKFYQYSSDSTIDSIVKAFVNNMDGLDSTGELLGKIEIGKSEDNEIIVSENGVVLMVLNTAFTIDYTELERRINAKRIMRCKLKTQKFETIKNYIKELKFDGSISYKKWVESSSLAAEFPTEPNLDYPEEWVNISKN